MGTILNVVSELETDKDSGFKAIAIDLFEDLREHCRIYVFDKNGGNTSLTVDMVKVGQWLKQNLTMLSNDLKFRLPNYLYQ